MKWRAWLKRGFKWLALGLLALVVLALIDGWRAFGARATGERRARMERSKQWKDGAFENPEPLVNYVGKSFTAMRDVSDDVSPRKPLSFPETPPARFAAPPPTGLRVTWFGHSTTLIEIDGKRVLTDPVWSDRVGPIDGVGPTRWFPPLIALDALPAIDAVIVSHDHYDHLDRPTVIALAGKVARFVVPLGIGAHLEYWGVPAAKITELDWWEDVRIGPSGGAGELRIVCTPARHASGRTLWDKDAKLWGSYALLGEHHRVWYSGDTGLFDGMNEIGARFGPFDLSMIEIGQYNQAWPDWHIGPEQAVRAHGMVKAKVFFPIHWGLFRLASHGWTEPVERARAEVERRKASAVFPRPGESVEPEVARDWPPWWPKLPYKTAADDPIRSTSVAPEDAR